MRVFKYQLRVEDVQTIWLPKGAELLTVQTQQGTPCLWALVDEQAPTEERTILMYGTGHPVHVSTGRHHDGGAFVFHAFAGA